MKVNFWHKYAVVSHKSQMEIPAQFLGISVLFLFSIFLCLWGPIGFLFGIIVFSFFGFTFISYVKGLSMAREFYKTLEEYPVNGWKNNKKSPEAYTRSLYEIPCRGFPAPTNAFFAFENGNFKIPDFIDPDLYSLVLMARTNLKIISSGQKELYVTNTFFEDGYWCYAYPGISELNGESGYFVVFLHSNPKLKDLDYIIYSSFCTKNGWISSRDSIKENDVFRRYLISCFSDAQDEIEEELRHIKGEKLRSCTEFKVISTPIGEAPVDIRSQWVGCSIPFIQNVEKIGTDDFRFCFICRSEDALYSLSKHSLSAFSWWKNEISKDKETYEQLLFPIDGCELVQSKVIQDIRNQETKITKGPIRRW